MTLLHPLRGDSEFQPPAQARSEISDAEDHPAHRSDVGTSGHARAAPRASTGATLKIPVIGMGAVGTEVVAHLLVSTAASEIVAVDQNAVKAQAEIWDYAHTTSFIHAKHPRLVAGGWDETAGRDIVVITAGAQLERGESRRAHSSQDGNSTLARSASARPSEAGWFGFRRPDRAEPGQTGFGEARSTVIVSLHR
jgi:hypothetical protein